MNSREIPSSTPVANAAAHAAWLERLALASEEAQVLAACNQYLAALGAEQCAALPPDCRGACIESAAALSVAALEIVRTSLGRRDAGESEQRLAEFFGMANMRVAQLMRDRERQPALVRLFTAASAQASRELESMRTREPPPPE